MAVLALAMGLACAGQAMARVDLSAAAVQPWADQVFGKAFQQGRVSGLGIIVVQDGKVTFAKSYGYADYGLKQPIDPARTRFRVGSISKTFTALAVAQLLDRGQVKSLDDPVNRYLKRARLPKWRGREVTIWDLLTHHGGFEEQEWTFDPVTLPLSAADIARDIPRQDQRSADTADYCNFCTAMLGVMVEDVTGELLQDYLDANVFRPLGMTGALLNTSRSPSVNLGKPYGFKDGKAERFKYYPISEFYAPAGSVDATLDDMGRYMIAMLGGEGGAILSPRTRALMFTPHTRNHPGVSGFGMIWMLHDWNGEAVREHGGAINGYHSILTTFPGSNGGVFVSCFCADRQVRPKPGAPYQLTGFNFREMIYNHFLGSAPFHPVKAADLDQYAGLYGGERGDSRWPNRLAGVFGGHTIPVAVGKGGLLIGGQGPYLPIGGDVFRFPGLNAGDPFIPYTNREAIAFMRGPDGKVVRLTQQLGLNTGRKLTLMERPETTLALMSGVVLALLGLLAVFWKLPRGPAATWVRIGEVGTAVSSLAAVGGSVAAFLIGGFHFGQTSVERANLAGLLALPAVLTVIGAVATTIIAIALLAGWGGEGRRPLIKLNAVLVATGAVALSVLFVSSR